MGISKDLSGIWERSNYEAAAAYAEACRLKDKVKTYSDFCKLDSFIKSLEHLITKVYMQQEGYTMSGEIWTKDTQEGEEKQGKENL